jgi:hypothetical protein
MMKRRRADVCPRDRLKARYVRMLSAERARNKQARSGKCRVHEGDIRI